MIAPSVESRRSLRDDGIVCCTIGEEQYALRSADVRHITRAEDVSFRSETDGSVGSLEIADRTVPVFELGALFGRTSGPAAASRSAGHHVVVTGDAGSLVGWLADRIVRTPQAHVKEIVPLPSAIGGLATTWFDALVKVGERSVLLLAPRNLTSTVRKPVPLDPTPPFIDRTTGERATEPMVVIFSTPALPRCATSRYALSARQIAAIVHALPTMAVPGSAPHVAGIAWWRSAVVPVIDFRGGGRRDTDPRARYIIAHHRGELRQALVAIPIDSDIGLHRVTAAHRQVAGVARPAFAAGMFEIDGGPVALLDIEALLGPNQTDGTRLIA